MKTKLEAIDNAQTQAYRIKLLASVLSDYVQAFPNNDDVVEITSGFAGMVSDAAEAIITALGE